MAATPVEFVAPPGMTLTLYLYPYGSDTLANAGGDAATEATNRDGLYSATVTEAISGWHTAHIYESAALVAVGAVYMEDDTAIKRVHDPADRIYPVEDGAIPAAHSDASGGLAVIGGTNPVPSNPIQINGSSSAAARLAQMFGAARLITVDDATFSPTTTQFETDQTTDESAYYGEQVLFGLDGGNTGMTVRIRAYAFENSKVKLTVDTLKAAPANGHRFLMMGRIEQ